MTCTLSSRLSTATGPDVELDRDIYVLAGKSVWSDRFWDGIEGHGWQPRLSLTASLDAITALIEEALPDLRTLDIWGVRIDGVLRWQTAIAFGESHVRLDRLVATAALACCAALALALEAKEPTNG